MAKTKIDWTDYVWNALKGCSHASTGCANCYAEAIAGRFSNAGLWGHGLATRKDGRGKWTGVVILDMPTLVKPLSWKKPRRIFVTSGSDPGHPAVTDEMLDRLFAVMALCPQHTFQLLTKRPERMREYISDPRRQGMIARACIDMWIDGQVLNDENWPVKSIGDTDLPDDVTLHDWPLSNLWIGSSVENQAMADQRIPHLLATPAAKRFVSCEPLLGPVDLENILTLSGLRDTALGGECWGDCRCDDAWGHEPGCRRHGGDGEITRKLDWVIVGGESGPKARPMHPEWALTLRDQCADAEVPFFFKQWGEWTPGVNVDRQKGWVKTATWWDEEWDFGEENLARCDGHVDDEPDLYRVGKKAAGRLLDGIEHNAFPEEA